MTQKKDGKLQDGDITKTGITSVSAGDYTTTMNCVDGDVTLTGSATISLNTAKGSYNGATVMFEPAGGGASVNVGDKFKAGTAYTVTLNMPTAVASGDMPVTGYIEVPYETASGNKLTHIIPVTFASGNLVVSGGIYEWNKTTSTWTEIMPPKVAYAGASSVNFAGAYPKSNDPVPDANGYVSVQGPISSKDHSTLKGTNGLYNAANTKVDTNTKFTTTTPAKPFTVSTGTNINNLSAGQTYSVTVPFPYIYRAMNMANAAGNWQEPAPAQIPITIKVVGTSTPTTTTKDYTITGTATNGNISLDGNAPTSNSVSTTVTATYTGGSLTSLAPNSLTVKATPGKGYHFVSLSATNGNFGGNSSTTSSTATYTPVDKDDTITATFEANKATVTLQKDGTTKLSGVQVELKKGGVTLTATTDSNGVATFTTTSGKELEAGKWEIHTPASTASGATAKKAGELTIPDDSTDTTEATIDYWSVELEAGTNATGVGFTANPTATSATSTDAYLPGETVTVYAKPDTKYVGTDATWTGDAGNGTGAACSGTGDSATCTVGDGKTKFTASYTDMAAYTAKLKLLKNGVATDLVKGATVSIATAADGTADATPLTEDANGVYTNTQLKDKSYGYASITLSTGETYVVKLAQAFDYTHEEESVTLWEVTVDVNSTVAAAISRAPYGTAVVTAGGQDHTANNATRAAVKFLAPAKIASGNTESTDVVTLKSTTPATNYIDRASKNWWVGATATGTPANATSDKFGPTAATYVTAYFTPKAKLDVTPATATVNLKEGANTSFVTAVAAADGLVENTGATTTSGGLQYSVTASNSFSTTSDTTAASYLNVALGATTDLAYDGTTTLEIGAKPQALTAGQSETVYVWVYADDSTGTNVYDSVAVTLKVAEGEPLTVTGSVAWDTYTEKVTGGTDTTVDLSLEIKDGISSVTSVSLGATVLTANTDYTVANGVDANHKTLTITADGLKKLAEANIKGGGNSITVKAKNAVNQEKDASVNFTLSNSMPALASAAFTSGVTSGKWTKGSTFPTLEVKDNKTTQGVDNATTHTLTGPVVYTWYNGVSVIKTGTVNAATAIPSLDATEQNALTPGDTVRLVAKGTGKDWDKNGWTDSGTTKYWDAKPSGSDLYREAVEVTAQFTVAAPEVTPKVDLKGATAAEEDSNGYYKGSDISAGKTVLTGGSSVLLTTSTTAPKKYEFVKWTIAANGGGVFGTSGSATESTSMTPIFTPSKETTVVANWKKIATVEYTHGANATGPNAKSTSSAPANDQYEETLKNVGALITNIKDITIDAASATNFDLTIPATGVKGDLAANATTANKFVIKPKATTPAATYTITITTTYLKEGADTASDATDDVEATVVQTLTYVVPEPKYTITLKAAQGGTITGRYSKDPNLTNGSVTTGTFGAANADKTISVVKNDSVALTGNPSDGYKFVDWTLDDPPQGTATTDKLALKGTDPSNLYGAVTKPQTISAIFTPVTDLSKTDNSSGNTTSVNVGYATATPTPTVYGGKVDNAGAKDATVTFTLANQKINGAAQASVTSFTLNAPSSSPVTIGAKSGNTNGSQTVTVKAVDGLGVGVYEADLVITETTADETKTDSEGNKYPVTMNGKQSWTVHLTFTVGGGDVTVQVKLDGVNKNAERVELQPASGASVLMTVPASGSDNYTAKDLTLGTPYNILVNGVNTGKTVTPVTGSTAQTIVELWTLDLTPDPNDKSKGDVSASGGTLVNITQGNTNAADDVKGYVDGSQVTLTAAPKPGTPGYKFVKWTDEDPANDNGKDPWYNTNESALNPATITMKKAHTIIGHFDDIPAATQYHTVTYMDGSTTLATMVVADGDPHSIIADPYKAGYVFLYWTNADAADTKLYRQTAGAGFTTSITVSKDITFNANWQAEPTWPTFRDGVYGEEYASADATQAGFTYAVSDGTATVDTTNHVYNGLPTGLSLASATTGIISGRPAETGEYHFKLTITHTASTKTWEREYVILIDKATPSLSGISFANANNGVSTDALEITGTVRANRFKTNNWTNQLPQTYQYTDFVSTSAPGTSTQDAKDAGSLKVVEYNNTNVSTTAGTINFGSDTSQPGKVKFTPSTATATGAIVTHQTAQKYSDIYKSVEAPCTFNLGGKTYDISVTPDQIPTDNSGSYPKASVDIKVGGTLPADNAWQFDVFNHGNQGAHVTYTLEGANAENFILTETYTHKFKDTDSAPNNDAIDANTTGAAAGVSPNGKEFTVGLAQADNNTTGKKKVDTSVPGVYVAQVRVENWSVADDGTKTLQDTIIVPIRFEVEKDSFDASVQIDLYKFPASGTTADKVEKQKEPRGASVVFKYASGNASNDVTATWKSDATGDATGNAPGVYAGSLNKGTTYHVVVNGFDTGVTIGSANPSGTVNLYEVATEATPDDNDAAVKAAIEALQVPKDNTYLAAGESLSVATPDVYSTSATPKANYDFTKWQYTYLGSSATDGPNTANYPTFTMATGDDAKPVTLNALYAERGQDTVKIIYHENKSGTSTAASTDVLWNQVVDKSKDANLSGTVPTRNGFAFKEWNTAGDGTGTAYQPKGQVLAANLGSDLHVFAQWTKLTPTFGSVKDTYYSERYSASPAATAWTDTKGTADAADDVAANAPAVTYSVTTTGVTPASGETAGLPGGLTMGATGVITGRAYQVGTFKFKVVATAVDDTNVTWTSGELTIVVKKEQPRLANAGGTNSNIGAKYSTGIYYADVVADILKYREGVEVPSTDTDFYSNTSLVDSTSHKAKVDIWEDGKVIIGAYDATNNTSGLILNGSGSGAATTVAADGGVLSIDKLDSVPNQNNTAANEGDTLFTSGNNEVPLLWTPGDTKAGYPFRDGNTTPNTWEAIFLKAETNVYLTPGSEYKLKVEPTVIKFKVTVGKTDYKVYDDSITTPDYVDLTPSTADDITITNDGNETLYVTWEKTGTDAAKFSAPATSTATRTSLNASDSITPALTAVPNFNTTVGTYTAQVQVKAYDAATNGNLKGQGDVTLVLEVVEDTTFPFEVDTYLDNFEADTNATTPVGNEGVLGDVTSVVLESTDNTPVAGTPNEPSSGHVTGKYPFTLDATKTYTVKVNGVPLPGVYINKTSTSPLKVDLYEMALAEDGHGTGIPTANPAGGAAGYFLPGQRVTVTPTTASTGYTFGSWDEVLDTSSDTVSDDTSHTDFSKSNPLYYVMGDQPVKLTAKYSQVGARFKVVLNLNDSSNTAAIGYNGSETYKDVLTGGAWEDPNYMVDDGRAFGLDMPVAAADLATKKYTMTWDKHTFLGWSTDKNATSGGYSFTANQAAADADKTDGGDDVITLYAIWLADSDLALADLTVNGVYKHAINPDVYHGATGGSGTYNSYVGKNEAFDATNKIFDLTLETVTTAGDTNLGKSKVSGTPDDVGTKYSTVTVTDSNGDTASALYTIVIEKADVEPNASTPLPTTAIEVPHATTAGEIKQAILDELAKVQMDGDDTNETKINGVWEILTEPDPDVTSEQTISVKFTPTNAGTATTGKDHDDTKDGDHYNPYPTTVKVLVTKKLITQAYLDNNATMVPKSGSGLLTTVPVADSTLDDSDATDDPAYTNATNTNDVLVKEVSWTKNGTKLTAAEVAAETVAVSNDYALFITLTIEDGSAWRFDPDEFKTSTIAGLPADKITANDTVVVLRVNFPKRITVIDVSTDTPQDGQTSNAVWVPEIHKNDYTIVDGSVKWYESANTPATSGEVGSGSGASQVKFDKDKYYDLVVTVKLKDGMNFSDTIQKLKKGDSMNACTDPEDANATATVNTGRPPEEAADLTSKRFVTVETPYDPVAKTITIRYRAFQPADEELKSIRVEGVPGVYYAQTKDDGNHWKLRHDAADATATVGNTGSKNDVTFTLDTSVLKVYATYQNKVTGDLRTETTPMDSSRYKVFVAQTNGGVTTAKAIPADGFKDQYTYNSVARKDVEDFDGKTLVVQVNGTTVVAPVAGTLRVQQLRADSIAKVGTAQPTTTELRYELNDTFASTLNTMKATVTFNADVDELKNSELEKDVTELTYDDYSAYADTPATGKFDSNKTFFFEYGPADAPTFVAHATGDPSTLAANALLKTTAGASAELVPGATSMTSDMGGKTLYATYVDVNHNVVRVALGVIDMGSEFQVIIKDTNKNDPEYADELVAMPQTTADGMNYTDVSDPNAYIYEWRYWTPGSDGKAPTETGANGTWSTLPNTTPDRDKQIHHPAKDEVGVYIRVGATDRDSGTKQYSDPIEILPRSLNFDVKPWNKAPGDSSNVHKYVPSDFTFTDVKMVWDDINSKFKPAEHVFGGVANGDVLELTPATDWNDTALATAINDTAARPNYRNGDGWTKPLRGEVGDKITWPAVQEDSTVVYAITPSVADATSGYTVGGSGVKVAQTLTGATNVAVYRLRAQDQIPDRGTILAVEIIDENQHDPEYGDKLTANPKGPDGQPDTKPGLTYQWQVKQPDGTWKDIPGETGKDHFPGKNEVGEDIRVVVTDPTDGTKRESEELEIKARSLNFVVERQNRLHTDDTDATNTHEYVTADFMLTPVKADAAKDASGNVTMNGDKMATFTATNTYGGIYDNDDVTLTPAGTWNAAVGTRPDYRTPTTNTTIVASTSSGEVGKKIIWPQVFEGNLNKAGAAEPAGQDTDYDLGGTDLKNDKGVKVYRLAPQDEQLDRGEITGGAGGHVMHVNVDFQNYPTLLSSIPGHPDAEAANATGDDNDGAPKKDVAVTDKRETRPGEVLDHNDDTHRTDGTDGYPGSAYIAKWYPAKEGTTGNGDWAANFDPTDPTTTGGAALSGNFDGSAATVVVKVIPRAGYKYELLGEKPDNAKTATKFHFHFSKDFTVDLPVQNTGAAGVRKVTETKDSKNYDVYYMWYTFTNFTIPPFVSDPLDLKLTPEDFIYYANTDAANPPTGDHHHTVNTAGDNAPIPGGKQGVTFQYKLDRIIAAIDKGGVGTALGRTDNSTVTINSANYGTTWRLKAGTWIGDANKDLAEKSGSTYTTTGRTFKDTVNLPTTDNTGDSQDYDGLYVYIEVTVGGQDLIYGAPLCVTEGSGDLTPTVLTVKELTAESITATGAPTLSYTLPATFDASGVTKATIAFNQNTDVEPADYDTTTRADAADTAGKVYYFQKWDADTSSFMPLKHGDNLVSADNGRIVYICYTDVNNHIVRQPLGALKIKDAPKAGKISKITITYPEPVTGKVPTSIRTGKTTLWTYDMLTDEDEVSVAETSTSPIAAPHTDGTTWYTAGTTAPANAAAIKAMADASKKLAIDKTFAAGTYYMVEAKITSDGLDFDTDNGVTVNINGIEVTVGGAMNTRNDGTTPVAWAMAEYATDDNGTTDDTTDDVTYIIARYVAKTLDKTLVKELTIGYTAPVKDTQPDNNSYYTNSDVVTVTDHVKDNAATDQWYEVDDEDDFATTGKTAMKFKNDDGPGKDGDKYGYSKYYMVMSTFVPKTTPAPGYMLDDTTTVLVDGTLTVTADGTPVENTANLGKPGLQSAQATLVDGNVVVKTIYLTSEEPQPEDVTDLYVNYLAPVTGHTAPSAPSIWGDQAQADITDLDATDAVKTAAWYQLSGDPKTNANAWTENTTEVTGSKYAAETWYRAESFFTPDSTGGAGAGYKFAANQKIRINGIEVTVGAAAATEIKDPGDSAITLGYVKAEWGKKADNSDDTGKIKAMYIAKTLDKVDVTALAINYVTPVSTNAAAEYVNYLDRETVTVYHYGATANHDPDAGAVVDPDGTRWYPVANGTTFTYTAGDMMEIGATDDAKKYQDGKFYLVENVFHPKTGYKLTNATKVWVDGELEVPANNTAVPAKTGKTEGLLSAKAKLNSDGTITIQSIYKVPEKKPGEVNSITITYPEPKAETEPLPQRKNDRWTWQYLFDHVTVNEEMDTASTTIPKDTVGTTWYTTKLKADPSTVAHFATTGLDELVAAGFTFNTYYMVEGTITPDTGYVFVSGDIYVTINGILVKVDENAVKAKYDNAGNEIGWAMAESVKDTDGKVTAVKARYIAKTELPDTQVIDRVEAEVVAPTENAVRSETVTVIQAFFEDNKDATKRVTVSDATWTESDTFGSGYGTPADDKFHAGKYYQAVFTVTPNTVGEGYTFQHKDTNTPADGKDDDFVAFKVNGVTKANGTWVNDKRDPDGLTDEATRNGIKVISAQKNGDTNEYTITVQFPLTGEPKDLVVIGLADEPKSKQPVSGANIYTEQPTKPYQIINEGTATEQSHWEHWNGSAWVPTTTGETFKAGDFYRAVMDIQLKAGQENLYKFTEDTAGRVNTTDATKVTALPTTSPTLNNLKTNIIHNKTGDKVTTITLAKEFRVPKIKTLVEVDSPVPTAGAYAYDIDPDVKIHSTGVGKYTLSEGTGVQGRWYDDKYVLMDHSKPFEAGKDYYLITTATAESDYIFYDEETGYKWYESGSGATMASSATTLFKDGGPTQWKTENGEVVLARVAFKYTIPIKDPVLIPGWAEQPATGSALSSIRTEDKDFNIVGEPWWTKGEQESNDHIAVGTTADETTTYYAHIKIRPKDGVLVKDEAAYYRFNLNTTADTKFVTWKYLADEDVYYLVYQFEPTEKKPEPSNNGGGGGGGGGTVESPIVYYHLKDQGVTEDPTAEKVRRNSTPKKVPKVKATTGLKFLGWSEVDPSTLPAGTLPTLVDPTTFKITKDKWFYAVYEQGAEVDHLHYVIGFPNGTFAPDAKITRAEVATIIARSCLEGFVEGANYGNPGNYSDVTTHWAFSAIAFCAREGVFTGYEDGTFRPDRYITRQELATVVSRLAGIQTSKGMPFNDRDQIASWATNGVYTAYANGWVNGYEDNTFQPEREISRAETVKIFNGYLKRGVDAKGLEGLKEYVHSGVASNIEENGHDEYMTWPDVSKTHWAYHEIIEAANDHNYHWQDAEKKTPPEDWDEVYIDEKWRYNDNETDGAEKRDENMSMQKTFTVTYLVSSNGVTYDAITETVDRFASPKPENMPIAVPNEGYRFAGWSSTDPSTGTITLEDPTASSVTSDKWFYAVFEEDKPYELPVYSVTYVIGVLGNYDGATLERVEMFQAPSVSGLPQPTASEGYRFAGWSETDPADGSYTIVDPTANYVTGDKTFYAVYEEENKPYELPVYTVTYVIGENGSYDGATVEQVEMYQAPSVSGLPQPTANEGYSFVGWSETDPSTGSYTIMDPTANYVTGDKTFYAVYEAV